MAKGTLMPYNIKEIYRIWPRHHKSQQQIKNQNFLAEKLGAVLSAGEDTDL
jgi:hypothetical protein